MKKDTVIAMAVPAAIAAAGAALVAAGKMKRSIPEGIEAVQDFKAKKYLGKWYEIARMDYKWEKGLSNVTAVYTMNSDGTIRVDNRGYNPMKAKWEESVGKAKFAATPDVGMLKVSFFGPFYAGYNVVEIDRHYKYALVYGHNTDYIWLLSREKTMPEDVVRGYLRKAAQDGFDISRLLWTAQD